MSPRKPGRPPLPRNVRLHARLSVRLDMAAANQLARVARQLGVSEAEVMRYALRAFHLPEAP